MSEPSVENDATSEAEEYDAHQLWAEASKYCEVDLQHAVDALRAGAWAEFERLREERNEAHRAYHRARERCIEMAGKACLAAKAARGGS